MKNIDFRRKKQGKTDYRRRLKLLSNKKLRLVVRRSLKNIVVQIVEYSSKGDKILVSTSSKELEKQFGWKFSRTNLPASYLTGYLLGKKAVKLDVKEAILDIGFAESTKDSKLYSALKGVLDAGLKIPCSKDILPSEDLTLMSNSLEVKID